eukprot:scaffold1123_cov253-Pinguiococcus_pyrenoidosus.AAC.4
MSLRRSSSAAKVLSCRARILASLSSTSRFLVSMSSSRPCRALEIFSSCALHKASCSAVSSTKSGKSSSIGYIPTGSGHGWGCKSPKELRQTSSSAVSSPVPASLPVPVPVSVPPSSFPRPAKASWVVSGVDASISSASNPIAFATRPGSTCSGAALRSDLTDTGSFEDKTDARESRTKAAGTQKKRCGSSLCKKRKSQSSIQSDLTSVFEKPAESNGQAQSSALSPTDLRCSNTRGSARRNSVLHVCMIPGGGFGNTEKKAPHQCSKTLRQVSRAIVSSRRPSERKTFTKPSTKSGIQLAWPITGLQSDRQRKTDSLPLSARSKYRGSFCFRRIRLSSFPGSCSRKAQM